MNSFLIPSYMCARPRARQKSMKLNFLWKTSIFDHFHVTYIWSLKWLLSSYNGQFMNENIHRVKSFHIGIKKFVRALWRARDLYEINIFFSEEVFIRFWQKYIIRSLKYVLNTCSYNGWFTSNIIRRSIIFPRCKGEKKN